MQRLGFRSDAKRDSLGEAIMVYFYSDHLVVHMSDDLLLGLKIRGGKMRPFFGGKRDANSKWPKCVKNESFESLKKIERRSKKSSPRPKMVQHKKNKLEMTYRNLKKQFFIF